MDLLSNLPDDVLCHVLSFLPTKDAALTSVLSKRWRNLIAFVPNLDIEDSVFLYPENGKEERDEIRQLFMDFVDRVLALQGINKFSLGCSGVDSDRVDHWIQNVMVRGVSEINLSILLDLESRDDYNLSPKVFENKKLVKLELRFGVDICWLDGTIFLPMLKTLVLELVSLSVDKFEILLHALPALEELVMVGIEWKYGNVADVTVSSASLKTITINSSGCLDTLSFDTPSLVYICYSDYVVGDYPVAKMENLFEARISLCVFEEDISRARAPNNDWLEDDEDTTRKMHIVSSR